MSFKRWNIQKGKTIARSLCLTRFKWSIKLTFISSSFGKEQLVASGKNSCQYHILQQPAKIFRISEYSDYFGMQNFQCVKKKTLTLVRLDALPFFRIYQFSPGVLTSVVGPVSLPVSCKSHWACDLHCQNQRWRPTWTEFSNKCKRNWKSSSPSKKVILIKTVRWKTSKLFVLYGCQGFVFSDYCFMCFNIKLKRV